MEYALIRDGVVAQIVTPPDGHTIADCLGPLAASCVPVPAGATIEPGWTWDGAAFAPPAALSQAQIVAGALSHLAAHRYEREVAGITWDGAAIATDRDSQSKISAAYAMASAGHWADGGGWKCADGSWLILTSAQVQAMAVAVAAYVSACYAREAALVPAVTADPGTDITAGWPAPS